MRIARVLVSPELLRQLLSFPRGTEIVSAGMERRDVELTLTHPDLHDVALAEAERPPLMCPTYRREADVVLLMDWGQP